MQISRVYSLFLRIILLFVMFFLLLFSNSSSASAQCSLAKAKCYQNGPQCILDPCPAGCIPTDNQFAIDCSNPALFPCAAGVLYGNCIDAPTTSCPTDRPECATYIGNECSSRNGILQSCSDSDTPIGTCCYAKPSSCPQDMPECEFFDFQSQCTDLSGNVVKSCFDANTNLGNCCYNPAAATSCPVSKPECEIFSSDAECQILGGNLQKCSDYNTLFGGNCCYNPPATSPCPSTKPVCTILTGSECNLASGSIQGCTQSSGSVGNCCVVSSGYIDPDPNWGQNCQPCGINPTTGIQNLCDPVTPPLTCQNLPAEGMTCCETTNCSNCGSTPPGSNQLLFCDPKGNPTPDSSSGKIYTAIGCIPVAGSQEFTKWVLGWAMGIAGGIAFMFIIYSGFLIMTSAGNPKQAAAGKELLTAAVSGLILILFSTYMLRFIGVDILHIFS